MFVLAYLHAKVQRNPDTAKKKPVFFPKSHENVNEHLWEHGGDEQEMGRQEK